MGYISRDFLNAYNRAAANRTGSINKSSETNISSNDAKINKFNWIVSKGTVNTDNTNKTNTADNKNSERLSNFIYNTKHDGGTIRLHRGYSVTTTKKDGRTTSKKFVYNDGRVSDKTFEYDNKTGRLTSFASKSTDTKGRLAQETKYDFLKDKNGNNATNYTVNSYYDYKKDKDGNITRTCVRSVNDGVNKTSSSLILSQVLNSNGSVAQESYADEKAGKIVKRTYHKDGTLASETREDIDETKYTSYMRRISAILERENQITRQNELKEAREQMLQDSIDINIEQSFKYFK